ncbi:hypothetical protein F4861DRAFT_513593 [Xylaria intraflava]|nr:hypothetical protein F4861DRAFT_513593 [Xylaria intraflava]
MLTLLDALTSRNVEVDSQAPSGTNTTIETSVRPNSWVPWEDFNYGTLTRIFETELSSPYRETPVPRPLHKDLVVQNEETLEDLLRRFVVPTVNYALDGQAKRPHFGRGSRCNNSSIKPDWSLISDEHISRDRFLNLVPGDTKLGAKWRPSMAVENSQQWKKVLAQVATYMVASLSRYGFILTDKHLVALRLTRRHIQPGLAQNRPRRETAGRGRADSDATMTDSSGGSEYIDNDPQAWMWCDPEYATITWESYGKGSLTIKLALWCLAMMATHGDSFVDYSYPSLDSWRTVDDGYVHNTSGARKSKLDQNDTLQELGLGD